MIRVEQLSLNYENQVIGVTELPQLSWAMTSDLRGVYQTAYWLQLSLEESFESLLYNSKWIVSNQTAHIQLLPKDIPLVSGQTYYLRVKVQSNYKEESKWSPLTSFVTGILDSVEWVSEFISGETTQDKEESKSTLLRNSFFIDKPISAAYGYFTAQGLYKAYLNGVKIGHDELTPGWTSYNKRLLYQTYDLSTLIHQGENVLGAMVGAGWYKGEMGFLEARNNYGEQTSFFGQLLIRFTDGTSMVWGTSDEWLTQTGPIVFSEIYDGEIYDARLERQEWLTVTEPTMLDEWNRVNLVEVDKNILVSQPSNRPMINERIAVQQLLTTPQGDTVLDFGQNLTGWIEFCVAASTGSRVVLECFETLDKDGNVYQANLRKAKEKLVYITKGDGVEYFCPSFTFQGFRYAKVTEYPTEPKAEYFTALVVHSQLYTTGHFECSNPLLNQLQHNIKWSLKGNFLDIPTDCPQRNERVGWTGDAQIFCRTANFLVNAYGFFAKWLQDVAADQLPEGGVPHVVPDILTGHPKVNEDWLLSQGTHSAAAWADVAVIAPWTLYLTYGDQTILETQFESMKKWIDFMSNHAVDNIWNYKLQFGDWVALDAEEGSYFGATPNDLTCTAYYAYSTSLFAKICEVLGKNQLAKTYQKKCTEIKKTYQQTFFTSEGELLVSTQTAHIISLYFNMIPAEWKEKTAASLVKLLQEQNGHLVTGFVGTPYFCQVLSDNGYIDEAYDLLLQEDFPSWLYQVKKGATTIWEHWDGIKEDGSMWSPDMNSFNHYAYGAVGEWMYRNILGIEIDEQRPGYQHIIFHPLINSHLAHAKGSYKSIHGKIAVAWKYLQKNTIELQVEVPVNSTATVYLEGCKEIIDSDGLVFSEKERTPETELSSGEYNFIFTKKEF